MFSAETTARSEAWWRRLGSVYFGIAAVAVVTIVFALAVSYATTSGFQDGVRKSALLSARQSEILRLAMLAQNIGAPQNDVFLSHDPAHERRVLNAASEAFRLEQARVLRGYAGVSISPFDAQIRSVLEEAGVLAGQLSVNAQRTLDDYEAGRATRASEDMASADRTFRGLMARFDRASHLLGLAKTAHLERQLRRTASMRQLEILSAVAACLIVVVMSLYGGRLWRALRANAELRGKMLEEAAAARDSMRRYADDVSHELRGPISKMRLDVEVLLAMDRSAAQYRAGLEVVLTECERLSRIVESFLFMARAEHTSGGVVVASLDARKELDAIVEFFSAMAEDAGVKLAVRGSASVAADRTLLQRAVSNLLSNALAHTPRGGHIQLRVEASPEHTLISVQDNGAGMSPDLLSRAFERFQRGADEPPSGAGLGLAIVKSIMEMHGGRVSIQSEIGAGTTVSLAFPAPGQPVRSDRKITAL